MKFGSTGVWLGVVVAAMVPVALSSLALRPQEAWPQPVVIEAPRDVPMQRGVTPAVAPMVAEAPREIAPEPQTRQEKVKAELDAVARERRVEQVRQATSENTETFLRQQLVEMEKRIAELRHERQSVEAQTAERGAQLEREKMAVEIERLRKAYAETKGLFDRGLASSGTLLDAEKNLAIAEATMKQSEFDSVARRMRAESEMRLQEAQGDYEKLASKYELALQEKQRIEQERVGVVGGVRGGVATGVVGGVRGRLITDPDVTVGRGDVLVIAISSEPTLPSSYSVQPDGSIRFPFLGSIAVQGLTAQRVHDDITKRLKDKKLAEGATIKVSISRATGSVR